MTIVGVNYEKCRLKISDTTKDVDGVIEGLKGCYGNLGMRGEENG
eukprot:CAMPEP_0182511970 /NCGR_PEP_ID=MMETSP1321-20130603/31358_1 /TAXON_ID=91990 /ORGANISM="Bolidomonas sp., Strain RCC1657" /LENGTH=44 /DNA_ID= /DNA_START= /DNA_END= /DNA_ORIENTATION=